MRAEPISAPHAFHAEGPVWWPAWGAIRYVDLTNGDILTAREDGEADRVHVGAVAAAFRPRVGGGAVIGVERGFALAERDDLADAAQVATAFEDTSIRFNDGATDPDGAFYCGSMAYDQRAGAAEMYLFGTDRSVTKVFGDVTISNGLGWSPDGALAYYNDTPTRTISVFDWTSGGGLANRRDFVRLPAELAGNPDGLCVDAEGGVWIALYGGAAVHRYDSDGSLSQVIELDVSNVTACTFGDDDLGTLYVTTTKENAPSEELDRAGAVYRVRPGVAGLLPTPYAG